MNTDLTFTPYRVMDVRKPSAKLAYSELFYKFGMQYHDGGWNALFVDSHAAWVPDQADEVVDYMFVNPPYNSQSYYTGAMGLLETIAAR